MSREPSGAQMRFAKAIADTLGIPFPDPATRQSLFIFIRDHRAEFDHSVKKKQGKERMYPDDDLNADPEDYPSPEDYGLDPYTGGLADY